MRMTRTLAAAATLLTALVLGVGSAAADPASSVGDGTGDPQLKKTAPVSTDGTYDQCNYVYDWDRPTKRYGAGLPPLAPNPYVKQIQCLINVGSTYPYWVTVDGQFGPRTDAAVRWVQDCNDTSGGVDGIVGQWTWLDLYIPDWQCAL
jgi:peptidoglycan hydrolase-like protein with peptidoglycan-binding domain